jgi:hypothetical protein
MRPAPGSSTVLSVGRLLGSGDMVFLKEKKIVGDDEDMITVFPVPDGVLHQGTEKGAALNGPRCRYNINRE